LKETKIVKKSNIMFKSAYLVVGLPGVGLIGKTVADFFINELKGKLIAELYSPYFPHQVFMEKSGLLKPIKSSFYHVKAGKNDLVLITGDVQALSSEGQYAICNVVLDYCESIGVNNILSIGGYISGKLGGSTSVFGLTTNKKLIPKLKKSGVVFGKAKGSIVGAAGLIPTFGGVRGMNGICLLGETHGAYVDPASARDIVKIMMKYLDFEIDINGLEKKAREGEKIIRKIEKEVKKAISMQSGGEASSRDLSYIR